MYLENIKCPNDVKKLNTSQLNVLCNEIRQHLIETVSKNGGHLASNLGIVELTVGLHYVFNSPNDSIVFDVGHQSYVHKMLTGRLDNFKTIRKEGGLSGFMNPQESEHDPVITGHSSNSISVACGIADANILLKNNNYSIAVVGDGALTGGMTFEALNSSGQGKDKLIVILNDNKMSISRNVGSLSKHLLRIRIGERYIRLKGKIRTGFNKIPLIGKPIENFIGSVKTALKGALLKSNYFESLGYYYLGPIDGNNVEDVIMALNSAKSITRPVLIHACTVKGKGFAFAEKSPTSYHGVSSFNSDLGFEASDNSFSSEMGKELVNIANTNNKVCAVTAAMTEGTGLLPFKKAYKDRFYDVGIAEEHAITFCCGLASKGLRPVFAVYSSFLQRGYDQLIHDAAITSQNLTLCVDRAGIVGEDGVTHQGLFDVAFLNTIPNVKVYSPTYFDELRVMLGKAVEEDGISVVRYPRGKESAQPDGYSYNCEDYAVFGNSDSIVVTYGRLFTNVYNAAQRANAACCKINVVKPLPNGLIEELMKYKNVFVIEEGIKSGGLGEHIGFKLMESGYNGKFSLRAVNDEFVAHMSTESAFKKLGFDEDSIVDYLKEPNN